MCVPRVCMYTYAYMYIYTYVFPSLSLSLSLSLSIYVYIYIYTHTNPCSSTALAFRAGIARWRTREKMLLIPTGRNLPKMYMHKVD